MLDRSTPEALSRPSSMGDLPAHYAAGGSGLILGIYPLIMENQVGKQMENAMEARYRDVFFFVFRGFCLKDLGLRG